MPLVAIASSFSQLNYLCFVDSQVENLLVALSLEGVVTTLGVSYAMPLIAIASSYIKLLILCWSNIECQFS